MRANSYVIGKSLGHKTQQATAIYARLNIDPAKASVERATIAMMETLKQNRYYKERLMSLLYSINNFD